MISLKRLFTRHCKYFKVTNSIYTNTKLLCWEDMYKILQVSDFIDRMKNDKEQYHSDNVQCNQRTKEKIRSFLQQNLVTTKNKHSKVYTQSKLEKLSNWDDFLFSPRTNNKLPNNYILVLKPRHKHYKKVDNERH